MLVMIDEKDKKILDELKKIPVTLQKI